MKHELRLQSWLSFTSIRSVNFSWDKLPLISAFFLNIMLSKFLHLKWLFQITKNYVYWYLAFCFLPNYYLRSTIKTVFLLSWHTIIWFLSTITTIGIALFLSALFIGSFLFSYLIIASWSFTVFFINTHTTPTWDCLLIINWKILNWLLIATIEYRVSTISKLARFLLQWACYILLLCIVFLLIWLTTLKLHTFFSLLDLALL